MAAICVFCASSTRIDPAHVEVAAQVGAELARRGHSLVSGGGNLASMGAVARAARAGGARTVGVIPSALLELEVGDRDADELLVVDDMRTRKGRMDARSDAFLTLPGGLGTLEELLEVWVSRSLGMHDKPVVALDPDGLYAPLRAQVDLMVERGFVRSPAVAALQWATGVEEALDLVEAGLRAPRAFRPLVEEVLEAEP
ncbi:MAG TPA: TIGR00730 family Rossman fold protein [Mycobacteriales bacterium]|nr:TIGR00730 family Rossman fold protein [Mycobacteriales bacterium]